VSAKQKQTGRRLPRHVCHDHDAKVALLHEWLLQRLAITFLVQVSDMLGHVPGEVNDA